MSPANHPDQRGSVNDETLSALFDGELEGDAARFALRRLEHDAGWRETCGRWQLAGDVLRRQAVGVAPAGFAERVAAKLAESASVAVAASNSTAAVPLPARSVASRAADAWHSRRWLGRAALAASVAVAALFVTRPFGGAGDEAARSPAPLATAPVPQTAPQIAGTVASPVLPVEATVASATSAVAAVEAPHRVVERRARAAAPSSLRTVNRRAAPERQIAAAAVSPSADAIASAAAPAASVQPNPFKPQTSDIVTRPWPRAVLPTASAGALTASYGGSGAGSPSFYPFEPNLSQGQPRASNGADTPPQP